MTERLPDDPEAREAWLERWAQEQQERLGDTPAPRALQVRRALAKSAVKLDRAVTRHMDRVLDRGLGTSGASTTDEHGFVDRINYVPTAWHVAPRALRAVGAGPGDTFVDFGCGRGRVVHQAAKWPLRRVIGVEVVHELAEHARALLGAHAGEHRCPDVRIVEGDVLEFPIPDDLTIGFLFDPFRNETLDAVLAAIVASIDRRPRRVRLIYVHPQQGDRVLATGRFRLIGENRGGLRDVQLFRAAIFESC